MRIQIDNAIIDKISTMKDKSLKISLVTRELSPDSMAELFSHYQQEANIEFTPEEDSKTPGQRLRASLYVLWEQQYKEQYKDFAVFYEVNMERIINKIKDKLS